MGTQIQTRGNYTRFKPTTSVQPAKIDGSGWEEGTTPLARPTIVAQGRDALKQGDGVRNTPEGRSRVHLAQGEASRESGRAETGIGYAQPWD